MELKVCDDPDAVPQPGLPAVDGLVQQASRGFADYAVTLEGTCPEGISVEERL